MVHLLLTLNTVNTIFNKLFFHEGGSFYVETSQLICKANHGHVSTWKGTPSWKNYLSIYNPDHILV